MQLPEAAGPQYKKSWHELKRKRARAPHECECLDIMTLQGCNRALGECMKICANAKVGASSKVSVNTHRCG